jgi:hypothetical protein
MKDLKKAFEAVLPKKMIVVEAVIDMPPYNGAKEEVVVHNLLTNKIAVFRKSPVPKESGYIVFNNEEEFWSHVDIISFKIFCPEIEASEMLRLKLEILLFDKV